MMFVSLGLALVWATAEDRLMQGAPRGTVEEATAEDRLLSECFLVNATCHRNDWGIWRIDCNNSGYNIYHRFTEYELNNDRIRKWSWRPTKNGSSIELFVKGKKDDRNREVAMSKICPPRKVVKCGKLVGATCESSSKGITKIVCDSGKATNKSKAIMSSFFYKHNVFYRPSSDGKYLEMTGNKDFFRRDSMLRLSEWNRIPMSHLCE